MGVEREFASYNRISSKKLHKKANRKGKTHIITTTNAVSSAPSPLYPDKKKKKNFRIKNKKVVNNDDVNFFNV